MPRSVWRAKFEFSTPSAMPLKLSGVPMSYPLNRASRSSKDTSV